MQTQNTNTLTSGVVINKSTGLYTISHGEDSVICRLSPKLWKDFDAMTFPEGKQRDGLAVNNKQIDPVVIGDRVTYTLADHGQGIIVDIAPRRNHLARRAAKPMPSAHAFEQVIAANLDQVIPIFAAAEPPPKWPMLDRYLVAAESCGIPSIIVITKFDLIKGHRAETELLAVIQRYQEIGYPIILTSAISGQGLEDLRQVMADKTSALVGKSGVGKSTLLNMLEPGLGIRVQTVNPTTGKGRHTTTNLEMFTLANGGAIIDTPGTREFGIWGLNPGEIADYFPEMRPLLGQCRFGLSCQHDQEPGCAIRKAVMDGQISPYRYKSYLRMKADL